MEARWKAPQCPFAVEYSPKVLDDIRLAVVDAFFSLPRGGAEIGGLLLGRWEKGRVVITDSIALECEHAFGPSFTLSPADLVRLTELIAAAKKNPASIPVGWYHSHTRSEVFLSEADQEIHKRFFPEPWQVALVMKPHTFQPTRAGFFFREKDGSIHGESSYEEFVLDPLPMKPVPSHGSTSAVPEPAQGRLVADGHVIEVTAAREPEPEPEPQPEPEVRNEVQPEARPEAAPALEAKPPERSRGWIAIAAVVVGIALAVGIFVTRARWFSASSPVSAASVKLATVDHNGQLVITWDGGAPEIQRSNSGMLTIADGLEPQNIALDAARLRGGSYTYGRQGEQVDITLTVHEPSGKSAVQSTTFVGKAASAPAAAPPAAQPSDLQKERDDLAAENRKLKDDLAKEVERNKKLEKTLADLRAVRNRDMQRKRLENQAADSGKQ